MATTRFDVTFYAPDTGVRTAVVILTSDADDGTKLQNAALAARMLAQKGETLTGISNADIAEAVIVPVEAPVVVEAPPEVDPPVEHMVHADGTSE